MTYAEILEELKSSLGESVEERIEQVVAQMVEQGYLITKESLAWAFRETMKA
jgi:hypothetical protein